MKIKSTGIITLKNSLFINVDYELGRYLRKLHAISTYNTIKLQKPSRGEHITIFPDGFDLGPFSCYAGMEADFSIYGRAKTNGNAIWFEVKCELAEKIRKQVNYQDNGHVLHFCIGYLYEGKKINVS